jgi:hypothetical protein
VIEKHTETIVQKRYLKDLVGVPQEVKAASPEDEKLHGPISLARDPEGFICVYCLVEKGERTPKNQHLYIQLVANDGPVPGQECNFLGTVNGRDLHAFWWVVQTKSEE